MRLEVSNFGGTAPLIDPTALGENMAANAKNVRFDRGVLSPGKLRMTTTSDYPDNQLSGSGVRSVSKLFNSGTRFAFGHPRGAMAFPSPISPSDTWGRVYFMTASGPSFTTTGQYSPGGLVKNPLSYRLGVPAPSSAAQINSVSVAEEYEEGAPDDNGDTEQILIEPDSVDVAYVYTFVDKYGHESSLSGASGPAKVAYDRTFSVSVKVSGGVPSRVNFDGGKRRIYRATFDGSSSAWQFLADIPIGMTQFTDSTPIGQEAEEAVSEGWLPAPSNLQNLCLVASAFAAGYIDGYVCYSELKLPHAWPAEYQYPIKYSPKGLMPLLNGLLIVTNGRPYWAEGTDPGSAVPRELPINAPCLSAESVVDMGSYAMYVSEEGLVAAGPNTAEIVTEGMIDREAMLALVDEDSTAFKFEDTYVFSTKGGRWLGFVPKKGFVEYNFGFAPSSFRTVSFSVRDNRHYFALTNSRIRVIDFSGGGGGNDDDGFSLGAEWCSKHWRTSPVSFSLLRVEADLYPIRVKLRCRYFSEPWQEYGYFEVNDPHACRLPVMTGGLWQICIQPPNGGNVYRAVLAQSGLESR